MSAARYFVFVEFTDPEVHSLLNNLRQALSSKTLQDSAHITVRGPYAARPDPKGVDLLSQKLHGQGVFIADVGMFKTQKGYVVFLHAISKIFEEIWWKPDFDSLSGSRTPHITIYETTEEKKAKAVMTFLKAEHMEIFTFGVVLTIYTSRQHSLLSGNEHLQVNQRKLPQERIHVNAGIHERANSLRNHLDYPSHHPIFQQKLL